MITRILKFKVVIIACLLCAACSSEAYAWIGCGGCGVSRRSYYRGGRLYSTSRPGFSIVIYRSTSRPVMYQPVIVPQPVVVQRAAAVQRDVAVQQPIVYHPITVQEPASTACEGGTCSLNAAN